MNISREHIDAIVNKLVEWSQVRASDADVFRHDLYGEFTERIEEDFNGGGQHRRVDPDPAKWAASLNQRTARGKVFFVFVRAGQKGLTNDEMYSWVDPERHRDRDSWVPRVGELKRMGFVIDTDQTRVGKSNMKQGVNRISEKGLALAKQKGWI